MLLECCKVFFLEKLQMWQNKKCLQMLQSLQMLQCFQCCKCCKCCGGLKIVPDVGKLSKCCECAGFSGCCNMKSLVGRQFFSLSSHDCNSVQVPPCEPVLICVLMAAYSCSFKWLYNHLIVVIVNALVPNGFAVVKESFIHQCYSRPHKFFSDTSFASRRLTPSDIGI